MKKWSITADTYRQQTVGVVSFYPERGWKIQQTGNLVEGTNECVKRSYGMEESAQSQLRYEIVQKQEDEKREKNFGFQGRSWERKQTRYRFVCSTRIRLTLYQHSSKKFPENFSEDLPRLGLFFEPDFIFFFLFFFFLHFGKT